MVQKYLNKDRFNWLTSGFLFSWGYTDFDDGKWRQNVLVTTIRCDDGFGHFGHEHPLSFYISFGTQHQNWVTSIHKSPSTSRSLFIEIHVYIEIVLGKSENSDKWNSKWAFFQRTSNSGTTGLWGAIYRSLGNENNVF